MRWSASATDRSSASKFVGTVQRIDVGMRPSDHRTIPESIPPGLRGSVVYVISSL
jgi:hypothetical protein